MIVRLREGLCFRAPMNNAGPRDVHQDKHCGPRRLDRPVDLWVIRE